MSPSPLLPQQGFCLASKGGSRDRAKAFPSLSYTQAPDFKTGDTHHFHAIPSSLMLQLSGAPRLAGIISHSGHPAAHPAPSVRKRTHYTVFWVAQKKEGEKRESVDNNNGR